MLSSPAQLIGGSVSNFTKWILVGLLTSASCSSPDEEAEASKNVEGDLEVSAPETSSARTDAEIQATARAIHDRVLVLDAHADIEIPDNLSRYAGPDGMSRVAPVKLHAGGVDAVVVAAAVGPGPRDEAGFVEARQQADAEVAAIHAQVADATTKTVLATSAEAIVEAHENGQVAMILGFQNARILGLDPKGVDEFHAAGVRVFALTHMGHNDFADSSRPVYNGETSSYEPDAEHGGLSELGVAAIQRINDLGAVVDISQLSKQAALQAIELSRAPVLATHSNVQALTNVRRNLSDEEIDRIGATGGVIHVAAFRGYLFDSNDPELDRRIRETRTEHGLPQKYDYPFELYWEIEGCEAQQAYTGAISDLLGEGSAEVVVNHIDYIVDRIGIDHAGIGNDFNHGGGIAGFIDASGALVVTEALVRRGYTRLRLKRSGVQTSCV